MNEDRLENLKIALGKRLKKIKTVPKHFDYEKNIFIGHDGIGIIGNECPNG
mgnify:CR=1 FL=1